MRRTQLEFHVPAFAVGYKYGISCKVSPAGPRDAEGRPRWCSIHSAAAGSGAVVGRMPSEARSWGSCQVSIPSIHCIWVRSWLTNLDFYNVCPGAWQLFMPEGGHSLVAYFKPTEILDSSKASKGTLSIPCPSVSTVDVQGQPKTFSHRVQFSSFTKRVRGEIWEYWLQYMSRDFLVAPL